MPRIIYNYKYVSDWIIVTLILKIWLSVMCVSAYDLLHIMQDLGLAKESEACVTVMYNDPILTGCYILVVY
jgi:hypothetical protein